MTLYKMARTAKSKHIGKLYKNLNEIAIVRRGYHIYKLEGRIGFDKAKWIMIHTLG